MRKSTLRRTPAALALALALTWAHPATAAAKTARAAQPDLWQRAWQWMERVWEGVPGGNPVLRAIQGKDRGTIDPDGAAPKAGGTASGTVGGDKGVGIDPDG